MRNLYIASSYFVFVACLLAPALARTQIVAPCLEARAIEAGYAYKWFDREAGGSPLEWDAGSIYARYGAFSRVTLYAEAGIWDIDQSDPQGSYSRWVVGGGGTGLLLRRGAWNVDAHFTYNEVYDHDESPLRSDRRTYGWNAGLLARGSFAWFQQRVDLYAGPMYVKDVAEWYPFSSLDPVTSEPEKNWGLCAGVYTTLYDYVSGFVYILQVDDPQFRFGVSLRSKGAQ